MRNLTETNRKKVTKNDLSVIMTRAHEIVRNQGVTLSQALLSSWATYKAQRNISFNTVYNKYYKNILTSVNKKINNLEVSEEITQDTFIKFNDVLNAGKFDARRSAVNTYLHKIAFNKVIDFYRTNKKNSNKLRISDYTNENGSEYMQLEADNQTDKNVVNAELSELIETQIHSLSEQNKQIIDLRFLNGYSYKEIAKIMDISNDNVKVSIHRAVKQLKENKTLKQAYNEY